MKKLTFISLALVLFVVFNLIPSQAVENKDTFSHVASFWHKVKDTIVQCDLCPHKCVLTDGQKGICTARKNIKGALYTLAYGNPVTLQVDPIEKKPFFHVAPGETAFSLAVAGCNMRCLFCQNWQISQSQPDQTTNYNLTPEAIVDLAIKSNSKFIAYTYTEPTVFYEYMLDIAKVAKARGLRNTMHTCGYVNHEPLIKLLKYMDAVNVDLKSFSNDFYHKMGMLVDLEPVLETLKAIKAQGVWLEITNLVIPGENDSPEQIRKMCIWIKDNLGDDVPLHLSRFMPAFKLANLPPTPVEKMEEAYNIAKEVGLKYVYIGNLPGVIQENTYCPNCKKLLVSRTGYRINEVNIKDGHCKFCGYKISGIWK
jgi:pyruvate formate lyase activating enzyme